MTDFSDFDVFSDKANVADADRVLLLDHELLYPDPENVRGEIDPAKIDEMAETIRERGQLQPITVAPKDDEGRYRIMFGERRWRACQKLGVQVRAIVSKTDDVEVRIDQFIENDQREDLSTADMIRFVTGQVAKGRSVAELARATGRNRTLLTRYQGLAKAPDYVAALFADISMRSAVALTQAAKADAAETRAFIENNAPEDMTVLACERLAREVGGKKTNAAPAEEPVGDPPAARDQGEALADVPLDPGATSDAIRDGEAERALDMTPVPVSAGSETTLSLDTPSPPRTAKPKPVKQRIQRPTIEIEGKRAMVIEALLHFDDEDAPRIVKWR